jgi:thioredoxin-dependent peroxiredoxin
MITDLVGSKAPDFSLPDQAGNSHSLSDYKGKTVLLYFYPKDMTPGCTTEACSFRDAMNDLKAADIQVLGVSVDSVESHKKFADRYKLNFPLLSDSNKKVVQEYGVWGEKKFMGVKYTGTSRESFLISPEGMILKHYPKVKPSEHVAEVIKDVTEFKTGK